MKCSGLLFWQLCEYNWLFWLFGLHSHEHHCIFNRPYSTLEYEQLCWKIIDHMISTGEWWEFFPHELSPFGYNETVAQEYFLWQKKKYGLADGIGTMHQKNPLMVKPSNPSLYPSTMNEWWFEKAQKNIDALLAWIIKCEITGKPFKIIRQELAFYIEHHLPLPTKHPDQRHKERMELRNPRTLHERHCSECQKPITTTYSQTDPREWCEECYRKLVY